MPIDFDVEPEFQTQIDWVEKFTKEEIYKPKIYKAGYVFGITEELKRESLKVRNLLNSNGAKFIISFFRFFYLKWCLYTRFSVFLQSCLVCEISFETDEVF